jgi:hypothetical protein
MRISPFLLTLALLAATGVPAVAQTDPAAALAGRSAIVVLGTVTKVAASDEPLLAASPSTVVIRIDRMYAGSELAGDQTGRSATVILSQLSQQGQPGALKVGSQALFFGNPRFLGKTITLADLGELPAPPAAAERSSPALEEGLRARRDAPLQARLASAEKVFSGRVETVRPLAVEAEARGGKPRPRDEHDPDWQIARVRVTSALRGTQKGAVVPVVFAASRDIVWFHAPKLRAGASVWILGQRPEESEKDLRATGGLKAVQEQQAVLVTHPLDVLPVADEKRLKALLPNQEVPK